MRTLAIETITHGRVLVEDAPEPSSGRLLVVFHGYGQSADEILQDVRRIPGVSGWRIAAVQGLHRFYTRNDQQVVASWMTRQDRELSIADNVEYVARVVDDVRGGPAPHPAPLVFLGFSQGAAMAYRAAVRGRHRAAGVIALAGDIPPELKAIAGAASGEARRSPSWPPVLIGVGTRERWYVTEEVDADLAFLRAHDVAHEVVRFDGAHEWTDEFRAAAGRWLARI